MDTESAYNILKLTKDLIDYAEDFYLRTNQLTDIIKKHMEDVREFLKSPDFSQIDIPETSIESLELLQADMQDSL